jgi:hypothetical protein
VKKALTYPLKLIAENAGTNGSVVMQRVIDSQDPNYGYNAAVDKFEDLMQSGIIDPTKVSCGVVCCDAVKKAEIMNVHGRCPCFDGRGFGRGMMVQEDWRFRLLHCVTRLLFPVCSCQVGIAAADDVSLV